MTAEDAARFRTDRGSGTAETRGAAGPTRQPLGTAAHRESLSGAGMDKLTEVPAVADDKGATSRSRGRAA